MYNVIDCQFLNSPQPYTVCRGIFPISDKFRIVGLAEHGSGAQVDLQSDPEFVSMFLFHHVEPLGMEGEREVILSKVGQFTVPVRIRAGQNTYYSSNMLRTVGTYIHTYVHTCVDAVYGLSVLCDM